MLVADLPNVFQEHAAAIGAMWQPVIDGIRQLLGEIVALLADAPTTHRPAISVAHAGSVENTIRTTADREFMRREWRGVIVFAATIELMRFNVVVESDHSLGGSWLPLRVSFNGKLYYHHVSGLRVVGPVDKGSTPTTADHVSDADLVESAAAAFQHIAELGKK